MSRENNTIYDFDIHAICEYFSTLDRQGPGSPEVTSKAAGFIDNLSEKSSICDIGCGTGGQTLVLAEQMQGYITGIDLCPDFIELFQKNVASHNLQSRIHGVVASMDDLPLKKEELDLIWSEGAIYNIGFEYGLTNWWNYLKIGGYIAVSEASWFTEERPYEIEEFWQNAYSGIDTVPNKIMQMQKTGYLPVAVFMLPENCWIENFYEPQKKAQRIFLEKNRGNPSAVEFISYQQYEAELYRKYKEYYGYVFYIGKKISK